MLIQLKEVEPHWKKLAEAVGLNGLDQIAEYVREDCVRHMYQLMWNCMRTYVGKQ